MKYLYKNTEVDAIRFDGTNQDDICEDFQCLVVPHGQSHHILKTGPDELLLSEGDYVVKWPDGLSVFNPETFSEKFETIRKMRVVRKNNKKLLEKRGKGFWGRVLAVQFGDNYLVLQNKRGAGRETAVVTYCDFEPTEKEIYRLRQLFLKKYKCELLKILSDTYFLGSIMNGIFYERTFIPVNKQTSLNFTENALSL